MDVVLTDDEVVALAVASGRPWPAPLTTVDARDPEALRCAVARGIRSLHIREIDQGERGEALRADAGAAVLHVVSASVWVGLMTSVDGSDPMPDDLAVYVHVGSEGVLTDVVLPGGVHDLRRDDGTALREAVGSIGTRQREGGSAVWMVRSAGAEGLAVRVASDLTVFTAANAGGLEVDDRATRDLRAAESSIGRARALLAAAGL